MPGRTRPIPKIAVLIALPLLVAGIVFAVKVGISNLAYFQATKLAAGWGGKQGNPSPRTLDAAERAINTALHLWYNNPDYLDLAAQIEGWKGYMAAMDEGEGAIARPHYQNSVAFLRRSLELRPAHAETWALLAEYKTRLNERDREWFVAKEKALELGGVKIEIVERMMRLD